MSTFNNSLGNLIPGLYWQNYISLVSQVNPVSYKTNVTLVAGDVKISKDGGGFANLTTLPSEVGTSGLISVELSAAETRNIEKAAIIKFHDVAGSEWQDCLLIIPAMQGVQCQKIRAGGTNIRHSRSRNERDVVINASLPGAVKRTIPTK